MKICMRSISYCRPLSLPVKILVTKRDCLIVPWRAPLLLLADNLNSEVAGQPRTVMLATEISITYIHCRKCVSYIKHECLQRAYNYDGL